MKKLAASILLLVYFAVTTGFVVSVHYCMNKLDSVELGYSAKTECGKCGMNTAKSQGCCKDEVQVVKLSADHQASKTQVPDFSLALLPKQPFALERSSLLSLQSVLSAPAHGPPLSEQDIHLRNCVFRI